MHTNHSTWSLSFSLKPFSSVSTVLDVPKLPGEKGSFNVVPVPAPSMSRLRSLMDHWPTTRLLPDKSLESPSPALDAGPVCVCFHLTLCSAPTLYPLLPSQPHQPQPRSRASQPTDHVTCKWTMSEKTGSIPVSCEIRWVSITHQTSTTHILSYSRRKFSSHKAHSYLPWTPSLWVRNG